MKKFLALILACCMVFALCACGAKQEAPKTENPAPVEADKPSEAPVDTAPVAAASTWPEKDITLICPYSAGGGSDTMARAVAAELNKYSDEYLNGHTVQVTNMTGAGGLTAWSYFKENSNNEYLMITHVSSEMNGWITNKDVEIYPTLFSPVAMFCWDSYVFTVAASAPYDTLEEFINYSKENPDTIIISGTGGVGSGSVDNVLYEWMCEYYGCDAEYVPYDGGGDVTSAILGGHVDATWANPSEVLPYVESGDVKLLAIAGNKRLDQLPDVPTTLELGFDKLQLTQYRSVIGSTAMPEEGVAMLASLLEKVAYSESFAEAYLNKNFLIADFQSGDAFIATIEQYMGYAEDIMDASW